jgi:hypothetical protein
VAFSTSLPELFVVAFALMDPNTIGISVGNVLRVEHSEHLFDTWCGVSFDGVEVS